MAVYEIRLKRDAEKELKILPQADFSRVVKKIQALSRDPRPVGSEKLKGEEGFRIRQGNYRIIYCIDDAESVIRIVKIGHRREVYR